MSEQKKTSWLPIAAAFLVPALLMGAMAFVQWRRAGSVVAENDVTPINLLLHVVNKNGESLENKTVLIARDDEKGAPSSNPLTTKTDSAGMATATITGADNYIIRIEHVVFRQRIAPGKPGAPIELTFTVDQ